MNKRLGVLAPGGPDFRLIIDTEDVRKSLTAVVDTLVARHGRFLQVSEDLYWNSLGPLFDEEAREPDQGLASLVDDYEESVEFSAETLEDRLEGCWHALRHLGGLLTVLAAADVAPANHEDVVALGWL